MCTEEDRQEELRTEIREEPMHEWIKDNRTDLMEDFISDHEDDFNTYCREQWKEVEHNDRYDI